MPVKKYREQVISVDACQFSGSNQQELINWSGGKVVVTDGNLMLIASDGITFIPINSTDWVIDNPWHNWMVMKNSDFQITYAPGPS